MRKILKILFVSTVLLWMYCAVRAVNILLVPQAQAGYFNTCYGTPNIPPSPSPTMPPEVTPTSQPGNISNGGNSGGGVGPPPSGQTSTTNAPGAATCNVPFDKPLLQGYARDTQTGDITLSWWRSVHPIDKQSIVFGSSLDNLNMGADNLPAASTSFTIHGYPKGQIIWAQVWEWSNGCAEISNSIDP